MLNRTVLIQVIFILFIPICIIDALNGYFLNNGVLVPASAIYKLVLFTLLIVAMVGNYIFAVLFFFITFILLYHAIYYDVEINSDVSVLIKIMTFFLLYEFFKSSLGSLKEKHIIVIERIFIFSSVIVFANVFSGLLGLGYTTYGALPASEYLGRGFKGFFFAGNELGALIICLYPIVISSFANKAKLRLLLNLLFLICSILISTKTAMLGMFILIIYDLYKLSKRSVAYKLSLLIFLPTMFVTLFFVFLEHIQERAVSLSYFLENKGAVYVIFTGRNDFIIDAMSYVFSRFNVMDLFFGIGIPFSEGRFKSTEMDFIDISIWFGVIFSIIIYLFYCFFARRVLTLTNSNIKPLVKLVFLLLFFISIFAGHVFTSAMVLPFLSLYYPYFYLKARVENDDN